MPVNIFEINEGEITTLEVGSIRISAHTRSGKTILTLTAVKGSDFITIQPSSSNQIIVKAGYKLDS